jgi:hypothetical protein
MKCISKPMPTKEVFDGEAFSFLISKYDYATTTGFSGISDFPINDCFNSLELLTLYHVLFVTSQTEPIKPWLENIFGKECISKWNISELGAWDAIFEEPNNGIMIVKSIRELIINFFEKTPEFKAYVYEKYYSKRNEEEYEKLIGGLCQDYVAEQSLIVMECMAYMFSLFFTVYTTHSASLQEINISPETANTEIYMYYQASTSRYYLLHKITEEKPL